MTTLPLFAASTGLLGAFGIDWRSLVLDGIAFLIVVALLGKFVYPSLARVLDAKTAELEAAAQSESEASLKLAEAQKEAEELLVKARKTADDLLATAHDEAALLAEESKARADREAKRIADDTTAKLARDVDAARQTLRHETARLVAEATGIVVGEKLDRNRDGELIARSLETKR